MTTTKEPTVTVELTQKELRLIRNALLAFESDFGHDEADVLAGIREVLHRLPADPSQ